MGCRHPTLRAFLVAPILLGPAPTAADSWVAVGPLGGDVRSLAVDPRDSRVVYLGTANGVLYRSRDGGQRWERPQPGFPERGMSLDDLAVDARGRVLVGFWEVNGSGGGVARSDDGGTTFKVFAGIAGQAVRALALAPSDPELLVAGTLDGVFRSEDGGGSWQRISPEGHAEIRNVDSLALDPRSAQTIYIGTWHLPWKTADGGRSWQPIHAGMIDDSDVMTMSVDRRDPDSLFATACSGIYRSWNAGGQWARIRGIPSSSRRTRSFAQDPERPEALYAGTTEGLWASADGGASWRLASAKELVVNAVVVSGGALLLGCDGAGVLRSLDRGESFAASNDGFRERFVSSVIVEPRSGRVFVGSQHDRQHGGVFAAARAGAPWTRLGGGLEGREVLALALLPGAELQLFAGTDDGLYLYSPGASSWRRLPMAIDGFDAHPRVSAVAVFAPRVLVLATPEGLLRSEDGGERWQRVPLGLARPVLALAASGGNPGLLAAATALGFYRSADAGRTWTETSPSLPDASIGGLAFLPGDERVLFATTTFGLLRSEDRGRSWARYGVGLPLSDITGLAFGPERGVVFASDFQEGGVYQSLDAGKSWARFGIEGPFGDRIWTLTTDPSAAPGRLLAATSGGLYELRPASPGGGSAAQETR